MDFDLSPDLIDDGPLSPRAVEAMRQGKSDMADLDAAELLVDSIAGVMVSVSTGGPPIEKVEHDYKRQHRAARAVLKRLGVPYRNRFDDLWLWHGKWSDGSLPSYASRRTFVATLFAPVREALEARADTSNGLVEGVDPGPTGWVAIDQKMERLRRRFQAAGDPDDFNAVGLQCLSVLGAIADQVFDPDLDVPAGTPMPGRDDVKARIGLYLRRVARGKQYEHVRKLVKAAYGQANTAKHHRTATRLDAGIAANSTALIVSTLRLFDEAERS